MGNSPEIIHFGTWA